MSELERMQYEKDQAEAEAACCAVQLDIDEVDNAEENAYIERMASEFEGY